jgi:hypothetical protein
LTPWPTATPKNVVTTVLRQLLATTTIRAGADRAAVPATARGRQECGTHDDRPVTFAQTVRRPVVPRRMLLRATCASPKVGSLGLPRETGRGTRGGDFVNGHDDLRAAGQEIFPVVATGFSLWTDVRSPQRLVRQGITPFPAVACARRRTDRR